MTSEDLLNAKSRYPQLEVLKTINIKHRLQTRLIRVEYSCDNN